MKSLTVLLICMAFASALTSQGVLFKDFTLSEATSEALKTDKLIFVDVYTDWCLPCKQMDQLVFTNSELEQFFGDHFIPVKWDAEDGKDGELSAARFGVSSYPTLLFLDGNGSLLVSHNGFLSVKDLMKMGNRALALTDNYTVIESFNANRSPDYETSDLKKILDLSRDHFFDGKLELIHQYLDNKSFISEDDLILIMDDIDHFDLPLLERITPLTTGLSDAEIAVRRNPAQRQQWKRKTQDALLTHIEESTQNNDFNRFVKSTEIMKLIPHFKKRDLEWMYYDFYRANDLNHYRVFATYMIETYLLKTSPEEVIQIDKERYGQLRSPALDQPDFEGEEAVVESNATPRLDSIEEIHSLGQYIANRLYAISGDFFAFYDDHTSLDMASQWAAMAYNYYPYDLKYYENHMTILYKKGDIVKVEALKKYLESMPLYREMKIKKKREAAITSY